MSPAKKRSRSLTSAYFGTDAIDLGHLRQMASSLKLPWQHVLASTGLPKASLSRLKHGAAGVKTTDRVLRAIEEYARREHISDDELARAAGDALLIEEQYEAALAAGNVMHGRRVIVETQRGDRFIGTTYESNSDIAKTGAATLHYYREITDKGLDLSQLAREGPAKADAKHIGVAVDSWITVIGVITVRELTPDAAEALAVGKKVKRLD